MVILIATKLFPPTYWLIIFKRSLFGIYLINYIFLIHLYLFYYFKCIFILSHSVYLSLYECENKESSNFFLADNKFILLKDLNMQVTIPK